MGKCGVLSSLGTGLSLVVAGVLACVALIGVVAFKGFPELRPDREPDEVVVPGVEAERATEREPVVLGAEASATPGAASGVTAPVASERARDLARRRAERRPRRGGRRRDGDTRERRAPERDRAPRPASPRPATAIRVEAPTRSADPVDAVVAPVVRGAEQAVRQVVDEAEPTVPTPPEAPPLPEGPEPLRPVLETVTDALDDPRGVVGALR